MAHKMLRAKSWLNAFLLIFFYYFLCLPISFSSIDAAELLDPVNETGICKSIDIRNKIGGLDELKGCKVIEGSLQILLFDNVNQTDFDNISFPELIEITDYLLLFRVNGLKSVGQLFPNLSVIRGQHLFTGGQSLIIYEMPSLQEINLYSLTRIIEGKVYIDKNPSLCFAKTIDWNKITSSNENFIRSFKTDNECPVCPAEINGLPCSRNESESSFFCWNTEHCQKTCPRCDKKKPCNDNGDCCDDRCLGGCGRDTTKCKVCAEYVLSTHEDNSLTCVKKCSGETLAFLNRRCISHDECVYMKRPTEIDLTISSSSSSSSKSNDYPYKVHEGSCLLECPPNYSNNNSEHSCTKCNNTCRKECKGARIDSINLAEHLKGCTHITGSIEIQIRGGKAVVKALQDNLEMIEEIDGYLKIVRSFSLVSLNFLKNLKRIRGNTLENDRNSLVILDNQNLQDLFDWKTHKEFIIDKGKLFVHFNPKLCYEKIEELRLKAQLLTPPTDTEVAKNSNGDKVACQVEPLSVTITRITSSSVSLEWDSFKIVDPRKLLSYVVYIIEAPEKNVNFYDGRDACGQDNWHVEDVPNMYDVDRVNHTLTSLKPFTQYAFFIKTYTISTEKGGAQSDINYFTTNPSKPSEPIGVTSSSSTSDSLVIRWRSPDNPNGKIKSYRIIGTRKPLRIPPNRNYCNNPIIIAETPKPTPTAPPKDPSDECKISSNKKAYDEQEETARIEFEDALHNKVYIKRTQSSPGRTKRNVDDDKMLDKHSNSSDNDYDDTVDEVNFKNITVPGMNYFEQFAYEVDLSSKSLTVEGLRHFTEYIIKVQACIEPYSANSELPCGKYAMITSHTRPKEDADTISNLSILNITFDSVTFKWTKPIDPNSDLVSVTTFYQRDDAKNPQFDCTPYQDFKNLTKNGNTVIHTISNIPPGNYSLYLKASSLHGNGPPSVSVIFKIAHNGSNTVLIVVLVLLFALVFILGGGFLFYWRYIKSTAVDRIPIKINPDYVPSIYQVDEWEVPRKNVELIKELGQGSFGMVWEGLGHDFKNFRAQKIRCAVKTVNEHSTLRERLDFLNEASVMKAFNTSHVVKLLGVVSLGQPALVVMELMVNGDLKTYLRCHRPENVDGVPPPSLKQILQMAIEIADGMAYLEGKKFVHRDLAARNCMVAENLTVKIGDFGMTRDIYETDYYRKGTRGLLPVRWMSPESLKDGVFSSSSDSWSYGVVLWEMATLASQPYQGLSNEQVLRYIMEGGIMERPENCPDKLYEVMRKCWNLKATKRPTFMQLCEILLPEASEKFSKDSFFHSDEGNEVRAIRSAANAAVAEFIADDAGDGDDADASTPLNALVPDERIVGIFNKSSLNNKGGLLTHDDNSIQSVHIDPNPVFYSMNEERSSANGYAGNGRTRNGKAQSQC